MSGARGNLKEKAPTKGAYRQRVQSLGLGNPVAAYTEGERSCYARALLVIYWPRISLCTRLLNSYDKLCQAALNNVSSI
ncbi:hypothetical protein NDU88_001011 [Pleurodeles waltl]|uniref:Uncharacterized protein n=1 Tax=Pleurodeles waltl TaxID=8319 RepID=A0AAV7WJ76_PLEWA|nr:hypothetical protein NDU88_001011 [Pleurodeles waltl]